MCKTDRNGYAAIGEIAVAGGLISTYITYLFSFNCYAYAMGEYGKWLVPGKGKKNTHGKKVNMPKKYTAKDVSQWVIKDFSKKVVRKLKNSKSKLGKGEYRIAIRVQKKYKEGKFYETEDFHFWKQDPKSSAWYDKPGSGELRYLGNVNADSSSYWGDYNSKTVYMAVKRKFTTN